MKVNVYQTIEITDEERLALGALLSGAVKPKRVATRDEIKDYVWSRGGGWKQSLQQEYQEAFAEPEEDLLGAPDEDEDEDLI